MFVWFDRPGESSSRRTVVGDIDRRCERKSGHVNCVSSVYVFISGQFSRDVIGCFKSNRWLGRDVIGCWFVNWLWRLSLVCRFVRFVLFVVN